MSSIHRAESFRCLRRRLAYRHASSRWQAFRKWGMTDCQPTGPRAARAAFREFASNGCPAGDSTSHPHRLKAPAAEESAVRLPDGWLSAVRSCLGRRLVPRLLSGTVAHLRPAATASPDKRCCLGSSPLPSTSARAVWIGGRDISTACRLHAPPPRACTVKTRWRGDLFKPPQRSGSSHVPQQRSLGGKSKMKRCGFYEVAQCC